MSPVPQALVPPQRVLLGPGPSDVAPSVLQALAKPTVGHLDPWLLEVMDELRELLRGVLGTRNEWTQAVSGTGSAAMEMTLVNLLEPGDPVLIGVCGYFGTRLVEMAERCGAEVTVVEGPWGRALDPERLREAAAGRPFKVLAAVHAETSTGVLQELAPLRAVADELGALLLVDAVTSVGCMPVEADAQGVDALYSCSQKGLSCTPGISPVSFSARAAERVLGRATKVRSWYLDASLLMNFWGSERRYHHTISSNLLCGLHEALRLVHAEGLEERFARHRLHGRAFAAGIEALGLELLVPAAERLPQLTAVRVPEGVDDLALRKRLLGEFGIEIGGGLGPLKGSLWRIGLMGSGSTRRNVLLGLSALRSALAAQGFRPDEDPLAAAQAVLEA